MARGLRGVRDDLSELARHLLGAACIPGPVESPPPSPRLRPSPSPTSRALAGVLRDLRELGSSLRSGVSRLLSGKGDSCGSGSGRDGGVGVAVAVAVGEEVVEFVQELVACPESWIEFPVPIKDDFGMTRPQREHIAAVERLVPNLETLRRSLCPNHMSEESFWKIYFALLQPKLNKHDSELLSTQEIMESMRITHKKMLSRVNTESQRLVAVMSNEGSNSQPEDDQAREACRITDTALQQSTHQQLVTPNEVDPSIVTKKQKSGLDILSSDTEEDTEEDDHIFLGTKYATSLRMEAGQMPSYSSDNWFHLRKRYDSFSDLHKAIQQSLQEKELMDGESSDWQNVEDSDFEIVEKLN